MLTTTGIPNNLRPSPLPADQPGRHNRIRKDRIYPLNRRRRLRRPRLPPILPPPARRPSLRRGTWSASLYCAGRKLGSPCDQDGRKARAGAFVCAGYVWAFCFWDCVQREKGLRDLFEDGSSIGLG